MNIAPRYVLRSVPPEKADYVPYGGARDLFYAREHEVVLSGPAETGKTLAACWKAHLLACKYAGCNGAIIRKTQASLYGSVLQTFQRVIKGAPVEAYGGERPEKYNYANGSTIWVGGMDNADKILSSERDFVYVNQAEELLQDDWEKLATRTTGRGSVVRYPQLFGDCNPGGSRHWIRERSQAGSLRLIISRHTDNPTLFDPATGEITAQGKRTMGILEGLTGVRRKRLLEGIWATAEGAVYDTFDPAIHVTERPDGDFQRWVLGMDEGYTNPAVVLLIGIDADNRLHVSREFYKRGVLQSAVVAHASELHAAKHIEIAAVDNSAAGLVADLIDAGIPAQGIKGRVRDGIAHIQDLLKVQGDGRPRLTVDPGCIETINEFESYIWKPEKDEPMKDSDHAMDALRYAAYATAQPMFITMENPFYDN